MLKVREVRSKAFVTGSESELEELKKRLTFTASSYMSKFGMDDEKLIRVYEEQDGGLWIPRGMVRKRVEERDWERVEIPFFYTLKDYQKEAVEEFIVKGGNGIITAQMGAGKTVVALYLAHLFGLKTLVVVHTEALFYQWIEKIKEICGIEASIIRGDICDLSSPIVVGMLKTLAIGKRIDRKKLYTTFGFTIYDEVHRCPTDKFHIVVGMFWDKYRLGLSGTLARQDKLHKIVIYHLGEIVHMKSKKIIPKVKTLFYADSACSTDRCYMNGEFFMPFFLNKISKVVERNFLLSYLAYTCFSKNRNVMILSDRLSILNAISFYLQKVFKVKEIGWLTGEKKEKGKIYLATFGSGSEGVDIPELDTLILATPRINIKQAIGRLLRQKEVRPIIFDIVDYNAVMIKYYQARKKVYREFGMDIEEKIISKAEVKKLMQGGKL